MKKRNWISSIRIIFIIGFVLPFGVGADGSTRLVYFGDSLSDAGNFYLAEEGATVTAPYLEPVPSAPYDLRGFRFTNGRVWAQKLARELDTRRSGRPALKRPGKFTNYAFGRARARFLENPEDGVPVDPMAPFPKYDLGEQRALFMTDFGWAIPTSATYVIWIGTNDVRDGLEALAGDPTGATTDGIITGALTAIGGHISELYLYGARKFLVLNVPDISITPGVTAQPEPVPTIASILSSSFNDNLELTLLGLEQALPGIQISRFDTFTLLNGVVQMPQVYGLTDVTNTCLTFFVENDFLCNKPRRYLFFDAAHPTTRGHRILANAVENFLDDDDSDDDDDDDDD